MLFCFVGFCVLCAFGFVVMLGALFDKDDDHAGAFFFGGVLALVSLFAAGRTLDDYYCYGTYPAKEEALYKQKHETRACSCDCCDKKPREEVEK